MKWYLSSAIAHSEDRIGSVLSLHGGVVLTTSPSFTAAPGGRFLGYILAAAPPSPCVLDSSEAFPPTDQCRVPCGLMVVSAGLVRTSWHAVPPYLTLAHLAAFRSRHYQKFPRLGRSPNGGQTRVASAVPRDSSYVSTYVDAHGFRIYVCISRSV